MNILCNTVSFTLHAMMCSKPGVCVAPELVWVESCMWRETHVLLPVQSLNWSQSFCGLPLKSFFVVVRSIFYIAALALYKGAWCVGQLVLFWIVGAHLHVLLHNWACLIWCIALDAALFILPEFCKGEPSAVHWSHGEAVINGQLVCLVILSVSPGVAVLLTGMLLPLTTDHTWIPIMQPVYYSC